MKAFTQVNTSNPLRTSAKTKQSRKSVKNGLSDQLRSRDLANSLGLIPGHPIARQRLANASSRALILLAA